jgi:maltooligosyltrehalose trehalohydrolase
MLENLKVKVINIENQMNSIQVEKGLGWRPTLGAWPEGDGVRFRVWAPDKERIDLFFDSPQREPIALEKYRDGTFGACVPHVRAGARYRYRIDGGNAFPDPATRFQPDGVHGPSEVVDPSFAWTDAGWRGVQSTDLVIYELHVGTFTPQGTFAGVTERLPYLKELGITAIELMPVADFPGQRGWGYDGVDLFAPARCYGRPDDLRTLVNEAHRLGIAVLLDVVYNHLGPEGNYLPSFSKHYWSQRKDNPWGGECLNFDGPNSSMVRQFFTENALFWIHEYHMDGLRLDATHAIHDDDPQHFIAKLTARVRESTPGRRIHFIAEDSRNLAHMIRPEGAGGWGLDGVWSDDFHHNVRVALAGDHEGYYQDYTGAIEHLVATLNQGWQFTGQHSKYLQEIRGTDPAGLPPEHFVFFIQNHDQVGNRALGERLHHQIDGAAYRAASALLLLAPEAPMLFMGQEWAASTPFQYFTDHPEELGRKVSEGRRNEFRHFSGFSDAKARERIPDPQAASTFVASRLKWDEIVREPHASMLRLHQRLLALRSEARRGRFVASVLGENTLLLRYDARDGAQSLLAVVHLKGAAKVAIARSNVVLTTEDAEFAQGSQPPEITRTADGVLIRFARPAAVLLRAPTN